ncbi:unnamed protein product [Cyprideis torosa]|uniref:Mannosyl-oligosaccharide glucosidase n=1 Tax=Cyprideis torosa TaxID=163714 RepID=A0A7R8W994_9CRUS|nr:unnamed protein product [Cyprideis torosa]CAG0884148.1 unnamed protein product [Cyprideis torosa]
MAKHQHPRHGHRKFRKGSSNEEVQGFGKAMMWLGLIVPLAAVGIYLGYQGYLETRVNTPLSEPKVVIKEGLDVPDRLWGSYRPGYYFGMKTRTPASLVAGLMWIVPAQVRSDVRLRHKCLQDDGVVYFGWLQHDGKSYGRQLIVDELVNLDVSFVKQPGGSHGGDWTAKVSLSSEYSQMATSNVYLFFYFTYEEGSSVSMSERGRVDAERSGQQVFGIGPGVGDFRVKFRTQNEIATFIKTAHAQNGSAQIEELILGGRREQVKVKGHEDPVVSWEDRKSIHDVRPTNVVVYQAVMLTNGSLEVVFQSGSFRDRETELSGEVYENDLRQHEEAFLARFNRVFFPPDSEKERTVAMAAFSNLIGGIGYFYGSSRVQSLYNPSPVPYWQAALYTAVPSRSFFPRGFLWDEGFHLILISAWDKDIARDIISHWLDLMNVEGWIPREQILGREARERVPVEFITQKNTNANPPTLLLGIETLLMSRQSQEQHFDPQTINFLRRAWPRLVKWYDWFNSTQSGPIPGTYRWRGRDAKTKLELNPKTLTSGLDDYPRASHPSEIERHLDLRCWMAFASGVMAEIAMIISEDHLKYQETEQYLKDPMLLDEHHWSAEDEMFADYGLHTSNIKLTRPPSNQPGVTLPMVRKELEPPKEGFVPSFGYVSLFPLLLRILQPDSPRLGKLLMDLRRPDLLWTPFGLRSLARTAPLYMKRNTEHDPPYWRGPIWINMNYLALKALHHYGSLKGPHQSVARELYQELRRNVVENIVNEYLKTGSLWEQYNDKTGKGQGCRPFTGWTSLIVLIIAEKY